MATATIIAALIGAGVSIWAGMENNNATRENNAEMRSLAEIQRQDALGAQKVQQQQNAEGMAFARKQAKIQQGNIEEDRAYTRLNDRWQKGLAVLNENQEMLANVSNIFGKRGK